MLIQDIIQVQDVQFRFYINLSCISTSWIFYFGENKLEESTEVENIDYVVCKICLKKLTLISAAHLFNHNITADEYKEKYGNFLSSEKFKKSCSSAGKTNKGKKYKLENHYYDDKIENIDYVECKICYAKMKSLTMHIKSHNLSKESYSRMFPNSIFNCKKYLEKRSLLTSGKNNGMYGKNHSEESKEKHSKTMKEKYPDGFKVWNDGLTKEDDERLRILGEKTSKTLREGYASGRLIVRSSTGELNNMYGRSIFDVWRKKYGNQKMLEMKEEYSKKMSSVIKLRENNSFKIGIFNIWVEKHGLEKAKEMWLELSAKKSLNSKGYTKGEGGYYKDTGIWMRSSYERRRAAYLDSIGVIWKYEEKAYNLENTTWRPDFHIYDEKGNLIRIEEIKGYVSDGFKRKFPKFCRLYPELLKITRILFEEDLEK